jgi:hypothetical protein
MTLSDPLPKFFCVRGKFSIIFLIVVGFVTLKVAAGCLEDEDLVMLLNAGGIDPSEVEEEG